jgi:uncharacterized repeat protein (TIGR01451 family)
MFNRRVRAILLAGIAATAATGVQAQVTPTPPGTAAGTEITNRATATYTVNGTAASTESNVARFVVDRKVNLTLVTEQPANRQVNLGQQGAYTAYRLTNLTNGIQDFVLNPDQTSLSLGILPGTDNFDVANLRVFVDANGVNGDGVYDPATDTGTFVDELGPNQSVIVYVVGDVPDTSAANLAFVSLQAAVAAGGTAGTQGGLLVQNSLDIVNSDNDIDVVFADNDSDDAFLGDLPRNGRARAYAAFEVGVRSVNLTVTKTSRVISDDLGLLNPRALPGAVIEYCLVVRNATLLTPASGVTLTDVVPPNTTYVPGSLSVGALGGATQCLVGGIPEDDDADDAGELDPYRGNFNTASRTVTATIPTLLGGGAVAASFRVTIN